MEKHIKELFHDEILKIALSYYGFQENEVVSKKGFESFIFEINHEGQEYILRISHSDHRTKEMIEAEIEWVHYLSDNHANVSTPIPSIHNNLVEVVQDDQSGYFTTTLFTKAKGDLIQRKEQMTNELFYELGKAVGHLHQLSKTYHPTHKRYHYFNDPFLLQSLQYIPAGKEIIIEKFNQLLDKTKSYERTNENYGLIHTDLHFGNMFITEELQLTFFDFDDCMYAHYAFDIAIIWFYFAVYTLHKAPYEEKNEIIQELYPAFLEGYNLYSKVPQEDIPKIIDYIQLRVFDLYAVYHRSFDVASDERAQKTVAYFEDIILNDTPIFDYSLIK